MRTRLLGSVAVAAAIVVGASGCEFMTTPDTQQIRQITDGINLQVGSLSVRNALLISNPSGSNARFIATVVNMSNQSEELSIQAKDNSADQQTVSIPANATVDLAKSAKADQVVFHKVDVKPGDLTKVFFTYPGASGASAGIPVLTGAMAEYATLVPTPAASPTTPTTGTPYPSGAATAPGTTASPIEPSPSPSASSNG
ncbi:hypothetical protein [Curtobacterium ammoniigenes]|uniref:hypothetical protein n=1 Tax=Curtobacterium ammoniigenes TaxID=395387 RepID=UPI00082A52F2|nr:hypothetical protein [Curtobacterium ammoniigenes]